MIPSRETHLVELVDETGTAIGQTTVERAHLAPGRLHRAFSVLLVAPDGRLLLQQRAAVKSRFPLRWANTCCGHPAPGESLPDAAARRLVEEMGIGSVSLTEIGVHLYYAEDPATGRIEYEFDHVLIGDLPGERQLMPDPDEVATVRWVSPDELRLALGSDPQSYAPWLAGVAECYFAHGSTPPAHTASAGRAPSAGPSVATGPDDDVTERAPERSGEQ